MPAPAVALVKRSIRMKRAGLAILGVRVEGDGRRRREVAEPDLVQSERLRRDVLESVDVDLVLERRHAGGDVLRADAHEIGAAGKHRLLGHPQHVRGELIDDLRARIGAREHIAARDIDLVCQHERHGLAGTRLASDRRPP